MIVCVCVCVGVSVCVCVCVCECQLQENLKALEEWNSMPLSAMSCQIARSETIFSKYYELKHQQVLKNPYVGLPIQDNLQFNRTNLRGSSVGISATVMIIKIMKTFLRSF